MSAPFSCRYLLAQLPNGPTVAVWFAVRTLGTGERSVHYSDRHAARSQGGLSKSRPVFVELCRAHPGCVMLYAALVVLVRNGHYTLP